MASNNLPAIPNRNGIVLNVVKKYMDKLSSKSNNKKIIANFSHIKQYGVLSMPAFRMISDEMIQKSSKGSIIMADINDLFVANKFRGKEKVNSMIGNMINTIKITLDESECIDYKIGKMGDEIYIYMPDKDEIESNKIVDKLHEIKENELTISAGATSDLSKGLINAIAIADEKMVINKSKFKSQRLKNICGNNLEKIISNVVETQLDKMRINLENLKNSNKPDLRNTFDKAISQLDLEEIELNENSSSNLVSSDKEDTFEKLKQKYTVEAKLIHGNKPQLISEHVLANMLSKHPVEDVITSEFFQGLGYKNAYKNIIKDRNANDFDILAIDLSGLKVINDTYGHEEGDNAIYDTLEHVKKTLENKKTKMYSKIIAKGGGNSYVLIEKMNSTMKHEILNEIQKYGTTKDSKYNMSIMCSVQSVDKHDINKDNFLKVVNSNLTEVEKDLQNQSFDRKLKDVEEIKSSIKKIYQQVINMDDIQLLLKQNSRQKENILEMIKIGFENCIEKQRSHSHLNRSRNHIDLFKENEVRRIRSARRLKACTNDVSL